MEHRSSIRNNKFSVTVLFLLRFPINYETGRWAMIYTELDHKIWENENILVPSCPFQKIIVRVFRQIQLVFDTILLDQFEDNCLEPLLIVFRTFLYSPFKYQMNCN